MKLKLESDKHPPTLGRMLTRHFVHNEMCIVNDRDGFERHSILKLFKNSNFIMSHFCDSINFFINPYDAHRLKFLIPLCQRIFKQ